MDQRCIIILWHSLFAVLFAGKPNIDFGSLSASQEEIHTFIDKDQKLPSLIHFGQPLVVICPSSSLSLSLFIVLCSSLCDRVANLSR